MTTPPTGIRARFKAAMAEAEAKAAGMSEDEINARLGPTTRAFFAAGERLEGSAQRAAINAGWTALITTGLILAGYQFGQNYAHQTPSFTEVAIICGLLFSLSWAGTTWVRRKGVDIGYLAGFISVLAVSAGSGGSLAMIGATSGLALGGGLAGLLVPTPAPKHDT